MNPDLIKAVMRVESDGLNVIGDKDLALHAYGPMQVRQPVCDDLKRVYGLDFVPSQFLSNRPLSFAAFCLYTDIYATAAHLGRPATDQDRARIWNGGPNGWKLPATEVYWQKCVKAVPSLGGA